MEVEDPPVVVERVQVEGREKNGRFDARLSRAATYQLLQRVEHLDAGGPAALVVSGRRYLVPGL